MRNAKFSGWAAVAVFLFSNAVRAEEWYAGRMALPPMAVKPVIDGDIGADEWRDAAKIQGFIMSRPASLDEREGHTFVGYDAENLYIAFSSEMHPDGKLVAMVRRDGSDVHHDDAIEFWIDPNRWRRDQEGDQRYR